MISRKPRMTRPWMITATMMFLPQWYNSSISKVQNITNDYQSITLPQKRPVSPGKDENTSKKAKPFEVPLHLRDSGSD